MIFLWTLTAINLVLFLAHSYYQKQGDGKRKATIQKVQDEVLNLQKANEDRDQKLEQIQDLVTDLKDSKSLEFLASELQRLSNTTREISKSQETTSKQVNGQIDNLNGEVQQIKSQQANARHHEGLLDSLSQIRQELNTVQSEVDALSKEIEKTSWHLLEQLTNNTQRIDKIEEQGNTNKIDPNEPQAENGNIAKLIKANEQFKKDYLAATNGVSITTQKELEQENNDADEISNPVYKELDYQITSAFSQLTAIKNFPLVTMPVRDSKVLLPTNGKKQSRGIGESRFQPHLLEYFGTKIKSNFSLHFQGAKRKYEPDFVLTIPDRGLFIDIEVDEPYNGMSRKPTHYIGSYDAERNSYFNKNGWVVIRFAEEQVVKEPLECCQFVESVVKTLLEEKTENTPTNPTLIQQWTYDESLEMETNLYRESYLGVTFDIAKAEQADGIEAYASPKSTFSDELVKVDSFRKTPDEPGIAELRQVLENLISEKTCGRFHYIDREYLAYPVKLHQSRLEWILTALDLVTLQELEFELSQIYNFSSEPKPFLFEEDQKKLSTKDLIEIAADYSYYTLISYQKLSGEQTIRTLSHLERTYSPEEDEWWYNSNDYVVAYCNLRKETRTFKFDRIRKIQIVNLNWNQTENNSAI